MMTISMTAKIKEIAVDYHKWPAKFDITIIFNFEQKLPRNFQIFPKTNN